MNNKVALIYENNQYNVCINETVISTFKDFDQSISKFKETINDNITLHTNSWSNIEKDLSEFNNEKIKINSEYKSISFDNMKYFYKTNKIFYMRNGQMIPLIGGYNFVYFILSMNFNGSLKNCEELLEFCTKILESNSTYRVSESSIIIANAGFDYGSAKYNFSTGKLNKGATIIQCSFNEFKDYVLNIIKNF